MSKRQRKKKRQKRKEEAPSVFPVRRFCVALCGLAIAGAAVHLAVRNNAPAESNVPKDFPLPPLQVVNANGERAVSIDSALLADFAKQHDLPDVPHLAELSVEAAQDIYGALEAIDRHAESADTFGQLGRVFQSHQFMNQALACYSKAIALAPDDFRWPYYVGRIQADKFEFAPAIDAYERSALLNSEYASTHLAIGNLYLQSGNAAKAKIAFERFNELRPKSTHGYLGLAQIAFDHREFATAVEQLTAAVARDSDDFRIHSLLGQTYQQTGQTEKAQHHLARVKHIDSRDRLTKRIYFDDPLHHQMLASNTTDAAITERLRFAMGTGQSEVAIQLASELCRRHPESAERMHSLALAYKQAKQFAEADRSVDKAIGLNSELVAVHLTKAQLLIIRRRNAEALKLLDWIVTQDPDSFDGQYYRGTAHVMENRFGEAIDAFRAAVRIQDDSARAHVALAEALGQSGQRLEAETEYRRALELDPTNARAIQMLERTNSNRRE